MPNPFQFVYLPLVYRLFTEPKAQGWHMALVFKGAREF
jgi:hypothetical protein